MSGAVLTVNADLLAEAMGLPFDAHLTDCAGSAEVQLYVTHKSIPESATHVAAMFKKIHRATVFDQFLPLNRKEQS